jgi:hypothetical protein
MYMYVTFVRLVDLREVSDKKVSRERHYPEQTLNHPTTVSIALWLTEMYFLIHILRVDNFNDWQFGSDKP